jgi:2-aminoadipate transaminase
VSAFPPIGLDPASDTPIYKQVADAIARFVKESTLESGAKLPPTRELAGQLGINRTTVSAAYQLLERRGLIRGEVGRGSFVAPQESESRGLQRWEDILPGASNQTERNPAKVTLSFASSRPADEDFPLSQFRSLAKEVIDGPNATSILQLGSPLGYQPLRSYLLEEARRNGLAGPEDDLIVTNGCQQAIDLLGRLFGRPGVSVALEEPVYHGLVRVFARTGSEICGIPVDDRGIDIGVLEQVLERQRPRLLVVTPSFQNPTGTTLPVDRRLRLLALASRFGCAVVENDIYSELHYSAPALPSLKQLDTSKNTILLRSYSKVSFPGLRVGWVIAPWPVVARLAEVKELSDLHSDQLSQAVLLRFAESGELENHLKRTRQRGAERLRAVLDACSRYLPPGARWTTPTGGMNLWIDLPAPLTADGLLREVEEEGVDFLPGRHFAVRQSHSRGLRISFGGLTPKQITRGIQILGLTAKRRFQAGLERSAMDSAPALV